ncbi:hypothetical protein GA0070616_1936 [Micromonospora nigra]|uniref:Uncharacterized protein n=1 Tax=Micromonospora nigra TaxID=145857 RepID=A0A1C6RSX4_9ACTN|nr:hypothetical protein GA0070616_1936 [Micromonospora nigra]
MVEVDVEDAAEHRAPPGAGAAEHHHHQQRQGQLATGDVRRGATDDQAVDHPTRRRETAGQGERHQLEAVRVEPQHPDPPFVVAQPRQHPPGRRAADPVHDEHHHDQVGQGQPVQVDRVGHPDQARRQPGDVQRQALLAAGQPAEVTGHQDRPDLGEGQRDHGEGDADRTQRHRPEQPGEDRPAGDGQQRRLPQGQPGPGDQDVGAVHPGGEVESVPEGEHAGATEQQVVPGGQATEDQAHGEQLQGARRVERPLEDARQVQRRVRQDQRHRQRDQRQEGAQPAPRPAVRRQFPGHRRRGRRALGTLDLGHAVATFPAMPCGRSSSTTASSATTQMSPSPEVP